MAEHKAIMASRGKVAGYFWVKVSTALGLLLDVLLLARTIVSYYVASRPMARREGASPKPMARFSCSANETRRINARDSAALTPLIDERIKEAPAKIAWMRILGAMA